MNQIARVPEATAGLSGTNSIKRVMRILARAILLCVALGAIVIALLFVAPGLAPQVVVWRVAVLKAKVTAKIPEIPFFTLIRWMRPGSPVYLGGMAESPNVNAAITNLYDDERSAQAGGRAYGRQCAQCHGDNAAGRAGPNLVAAVGRMTDWTFFSIVKWGRPGTAMLPQPISDLEIWQVHAYIRKIGLDVARKRSEDAALSPFQPITSEMILSGDHSGEWLTYSGRYGGWRHSVLTEISRKNIGQLRLAWVAELPSTSPSLESTPIVAGGRMFVTESPEGVTALDPRNGTILWQFHRAVPNDIPLCCGPQNRGVAILGNTIFIATLDAHLIALDVATGAKRWDIQVGDWHEGYSMTGAPLAIKDRIIVGMAGGDFGIRGFLASYAAKDGRLQWKFETVPGPGQPGHETWDGDSWKRGGVSTWTTGTYDADLGLIYWGTGNPSPVYNSKYRRGDDLYASSLVALDVETGQLRWYYQFTPHDDHDWDATQQSILADIPWQGQTRRVLFVPNKNGFFYALDRQTGQFLRATAFAKQTWANGFDRDGHPIFREGSAPSRNGSLVWPAAGGATNWWPSSYDPQRLSVYLAAVNAASIYFLDEVPNFRKGEAFGGSSFQRAANQPVSIAIKAIDVTTGGFRWESLLASGGMEVRGEVGGMLSTDNGLVFGGYSTSLFALDADTGKRLWTTPLGSMIHAPPITFTVEGHQYVSVIAGHTLFAFAMPNADVDPPAHTSRISRK